MIPNTPKLIWILIETGYMLNLSVKNVLSRVFKMTTAAGIARTVITYFKQFPANQSISIQKNKSAEADLFFLILGE